MSPLALQPHRVDSLCLADCTVQRAMDVGIRVAQETDLARYCRCDVVEHQLV
jgi:hypothetical protein